MNIQGFISNGKIIVEAKIRVVSTCGVRYVIQIYQETLMIVIQCDG